MSDESLKKFYDVVAACNRCGFCTSYCPTYIATGDEGQSPRGRNQTFRALIEGKIENPADAKEIIDSCLLCGECTAVCFSEVPTAQLMIQARNFINQATGLPTGLKIMLGHVLPKRKVLYWVLKIAFWGKALGISALLKKTGLLKKISPELDAAEGLISRVPLKFLFDYKQAGQRHEEALRKEDHENLSAEAKIEQLRKKNDTVPEHLMRKAGFTRPPKVAYLPVCGSQYLKPAIGLATIKLFERLKFDFIVPDLICCGLPAASYGVLDRVQAMAKENIKNIERGNYESLIADDSSCASHFKDYPKYFQEDRDWQSRAQAVAQRVKDFSSFLLQRGLIDHLKKVTWNGGPVAYHDPCKAQYALKITAPPRELLAAINRLTVVPVVDSDQCCGGGGTYSFVHPELSKDVLARKTKNVIASGCKILVTSSASCFIQLGAGLREANPAIEVLHLSEFLIRALEKQR